MTAVIIDAINFGRRFESRTLSAGVSTAVNNRKILRSINNCFSQIHIKRISEVNEVNELLFAGVVAGFSAPGIVNDLIGYGNRTDIIFRQNSADGSQCDHGFGLEL